MQLVVTRGKRSAISTKQQCSILCFCCPYDISIDCVDNKRSFFHAEKIPALGVSNSVSLSPVAVRISRSIAIEGQTDLSRVAYGSIGQNKMAKICLICAIMGKGGSTDMPTKMSEDFIHAAIDGFKAQRNRLDLRVAELRAMLNGGPPQAAAEPAPRQLRKFSSATLRRMREAQRLRWAKIRGESEPAGHSKTKAVKPKRRISPEGMKRIIAATKKRWRLQRAAKTKSTKAAKRRVPVRKAA
jgi:hypothetical protein